MIDVVITGASGFIGKALVQRLQADGLETLGLDRSHGDISDGDTWARLPAARYVVHLAGRSYVPDSWKDASGFLQANVCGVQQALDYCRRHGSQLTFTSAYVHGIPQRLPIRESDPAAPNNPYALSKYLAEQLCQFAASYQAIPVTVLRLFNLFGPGQRREFLVPTIIDQVLAGKTISVLDLKPRRDYVYLADVVEAIIKTISPRPGFTVLNIGSGKSLSVSQIIEQVQTAAGTALPVACANENRPQEIPEVQADITQAARILGWQPKWTFFAGLQAMLGREKISD